MSGIATAVAFHKAGYRDFIVLEKGSAVGGVWYWNRYPGLTCDVPSNLYQYDFALKPDWPRLWASGDEIRRYHEAVVHRHGLGGHIRLDTEVVETLWEDDRYRVTTSTGEELVADFVIMATGLLHHPFIPDIPGLDDFAGAVVHTAQWDDHIETAGRRIAVLGSGSTGVQVVSALQPSAADLTHFSRTPQWVLWAPMGLRQPRMISALFRAVPPINHALYRLLFWASGGLADVALKPTWRRRVVQHYARMSLRLQVRDPLLRRRLTPSDEPLCKRQVVSGSYYQAIQRPNAAVVTDSISRVSETAIVTADGTKHEVDVIVLATGFQAHQYMRPMNVRGRDGVTIDDVWVKGPRAYQMTAVPGFPNLFTVLGPNSPTGSILLQHTASLTAKWIINWLDRWSAGDIDSVEVTEEATDAFNTEVRDALGPTVWNTGCNSWYLTDDGVVDLYPFDRKKLESDLHRPADRDFVVVKKRVP